MMTGQKLSKKTLTWRLVLIFVIVEFFVVFGVLIILQLLSLTSYAPVAAGAVAGVSPAIVTLALSRHERTGKPN
jgi:hypothetical protein